MSSRNVDFDRRSREKLHKFKRLAQQAFFAMISSQLCFAALPSQVREQGLRAVWISVGGQMYSTSSCAIQILKYPCCARLFCILHTGQLQPRSGIECPIPSDGIDLARVCTRVSSSLEPEVRLLYVQRDSGEPVCTEPGERTGVSSSLEPVYTEPGEYDFPEVQKPLL